MTRNASEIFDDLRALANELEDLAATGRITMSTDSWNKDYPDTKPAVAQPWHRYRSRSTRPAG